MSNKGIKVTAVDLETGETSEQILQPGNYCLTLTEPLYLDSGQRYANGTLVLTLKRRK